MSIDRVKPKFDYNLNLVSGLTRAGQYRKMGVVPDPIWALTRR